LVQRAFVLEALGTQALKGITAPMEVWRVVSPLETLREATTPAPEDVKPLVGRDEEVGLIVRRWEQSKAGQGQVVLISGEAGIGKSALVDTLRARVRREGLTRVAIRCSPYHTNSALYPVIVHVQQALRFERYDSAEEKLVKLEQALRPLRLPLHEVVPLFIEELTKMLLESALLREAAEHYALTGPLAAVTIPTTLYDSLMARLDRLPTVREVAQLGAVLGREFAYELLHALTTMDEATLQHGLTQLVDAELLYQRGRPPRARYMFKHALIQDAAYTSLLKSTRQQYHQQIAQLLEARFPETVVAEPELLAHHYTEAGCHTQAVGYWQQAGTRALQRSANVEAIAHVQSELELLTALPDTPQRIQRELDLLTTLGPALLATKGYAAPEVVQAYTQARELCQQVGETPEHFPVLYGLWFFYFARSEHQTAMELGEQCLQLAQRVQDEALLQLAHLAIGYSWFYLGNPALACTHLEHTIALYDLEQHHVLAHRYGGIDPGISALGYVATSLWPELISPRSPCTSTSLIRIDAGNAWAL
jgi:predicted ATPase